MQSKQIKFDNTQKNHILDYFPDQKPTHDNSAIHFSELSNIFI